MEQIILELDQQQYLPDQTVKVKVVLKLKEPVNANGVYAMIYCFEKKKEERYVPIPYDEMMRMKELGLEITTNIKKTTNYAEGKIYEDEARLAVKGRYSNQTFEALFRLPENAVPTSREMGHDNRLIIWRVKVKIDIPLSPDINAEKEIFVTGL